VYFWLFNTLFYFRCISFVWSGMCLGLLLYVVRLEHFFYLNSGVFLLHLAKAHDWMCSSTFIEDGESDYWRC